MKLRTEINISSSEKKIDHKNKVYLTGSCFSENISTKFKFFGFDVLSNSHGIIYNPVSIETSIIDLSNDQPYQLEDLHQFNDKYFSYAHHGMFSNNDPVQVLKNINETLELHKTHIRSSDFVFVTLGTAWVYTHVRENLLVANCHKVPGSQFKKRLLSQSEITESIETIINRVQGMHSSASIIFTVSPVKHLKDGFVENQLSKSLLHTCIHSCLNENVTYFPAYEIMNDDLRDYRFWSEDMMHPNQVAIDYIWEKFTGTYFSNKTIEIMKEVQQLQQFISHRPLSSSPSDINQLEEEKRKKINEIRAKYPQLNLPWK